jgi:hypothetical protein
MIALKQSETYCSSECVCLFISDYQINQKFIFSGVMTNFDGNQWSIGPRLLTKVIKKYCNIDDFEKSTDCEGLTILPIEKCYAVAGWQWKYFFQESRTYKVLDAVKDSHFIHLWNYQSNHKHLQTAKPAALNVLAAEYCPRVFESNDYI